MQAGGFMFDLQAVLNKRLAALRHDEKKFGPREVVNDVTDNVSKEYILKQLQQAGILDKNGNMIYRIIG
ncbi:MAG: hypothetical protein ACI9FJ_003318 [Alteromonadaceae bacterium]